MSAILFLVLLSDTNAADLCLLDSMEPELVIIGCHLSVSEVVDAYREQIANAILSELNKDDDEIQIHGRN